MVSAWNFQPCSPLSWEGRKAGNGVNDPSCLHDDTSKQILECGDRRVSRLVNASMYQKGDTPQISCARDPPRPHPISLFTWLFTCILYQIL